MNLLAFESKRGDRYGEYMCPAENKKNDSNKHNEYMRLKKQGITLL